MIIERKIEAELIRWKDSESRKPQNDGQIPNFISLYQLVSLVRLQDH